MATPVDRALNDATRAVHGMLDNVRHAIPCGILKLFNTTDGGRCVQSYSAPDEAQRAAFDFYDNLIADPDAMVEFPVPVKDANGNPTGSMIRKRTSVKSLMLLDPAWRESTRVLERLLQTAVTECGFSFDKPDDATLRRMLTTPWAVGGPNGVTSQTRDPSFVNPASTFEFPERPDGNRRLYDPAHPTDPRRVPGWYPIGKPRRIVWPTPRVLDQNLVPTARLRTLYENCVTSSHTYLMHRNAPLGFHPMAVQVRNPLYPDVHAYSAYNTRVPEYIADFRASNGDGRYWIRNSIFGWTWPNGDPVQGARIVPHFLWTRSLEHRVPQTMEADILLTHGSLLDGDNLRTWSTYTADALLELLRWLNWIAFLLDSGNAGLDARAVMVDVFSVNAVYHGAQVEAYRMINRPYGSNVLGYRQAIAAEAQARENRARTATVGTPGYESTGSDAADITAFTIGTVGLAVKEAVESGDIVRPVIAVAMKGIAAIAGLIDSPDKPVSPFDLPMRVAGPGSPMLNGVSVTNALESWPAFRIPR